MARIKVFLDTDIIISSLLSKTGASFEIIKYKRFKKVISNTVAEEIKRVSKRADLNLELTKIALEKLEIATLDITKQEILNSYVEYVYDDKDAHVVASAKVAKTKLLLTHNTKHFNKEKIEKNLGITVLSPGELLQQLRQKTTNN